MKSENKMSFEEAAKVLGLKRGETVDSYQRAFEEVRKHMQRLCDEADTEEKKENYAKELSRFEEALEVATAYRPKKKGGFLRVAFALLFIGIIAAGFYWGPDLMSSQAAKQAAEARLPEAEIALKARNLTEAEKIYQEILEVAPKSKAAQEGLQRVSEERDVERRMQVRFALGKAQGLMDGRNWDEAEKAMEVALAMDPSDVQLQEFARRMKEGRRVDDILRIAEDIEQARREERWEELVLKVEQLEQANPDHARLDEFRNQAAEAKVVLANLRKKAATIYQEALALDKGEYSEEALVLLREAQRLSPSADAAALYRKMSSYVQTVKVPGDAETLAEGLARVRTGDKVLLGEGVFAESLLIPAGVSIEGVKGKTFIESKCEDGSVLVAQGSGPAIRLVGLTLRHTGVSNEKKRYPVLLVSGSEVVLEDCEISYGSGHGVAVMKGGRCQITGSEIKGCGWDGIAVMGAESLAVVSESRSVANLGHGLDVWDGGRAQINSSRFQDNGLTGVLITSKGVQSDILRSSIERNREVGLVVSSGSIANVTGNLIAGNMLGGVFGDDEGTELSLASNTIQKNGTAGLVVTNKATLKVNRENITSENEGKQEWLDADLSTAAVKPSTPILRALPVEE